MIDLFYHAKTPIGFGVGDVQTPNLLFNDKKTLPTIQKIYLYLFFSINFNVWCVCIYNFIV